MAEYIEVSIALNRVFKSFKHEIVGKSSSKECICIPLEELATDANGEVWLNMKAWEDTKFADQLYSLKQNLKSAQVEQLPLGNNNKPISPYLGSIRKPRVNNRNTAPSAAQSAPSGNDDNLPF